MSSKTKIVVLRMKEIIYTAIFIGLAIFLILLFFFMFRSEKEAPAPTAESVSPAVYAPGVYSASLSLGRQNVNVEVAVSPDRISAVTLVPLSDSVAAMYPLMQPSMDALSAQILESQSLSLVSSLCTASLLYAYFCPSRYLPIPRTRPSASFSSAASE